MALLRAVHKVGRMDMKSNGVATSGKDKEFSLRIKLCLLKDETPFQLIRALEDIEKEFQSKFRGKNKRKQQLERDLRYRWVRRELFRADQRYAAA